jgi:hypothetical protein
MSRRSKKSTMMYSSTNAARTGRKMARNWRTKYRLATGRGV